MWYNSSYNIRLISIIAMSTTTGSPSIRVATNLVSTGSCMHCMARILVERGTIRRRNIRFSSFYLMFYNPPESIYGIQKQWLGRIPSSTLLISHWVVIEVKVIITHIVVVDASTYTRPSLSNWKPKPEVKRVYPTYRTVAIGIWLILVESPRRRRTDYDCDLRMFTNLRDMFVYVLFTKLLSNVW